MQSGQNSGSPDEGVNDVTVNERIIDGALSSYRSSYGMFSHSSLKEVI